MKKGINLDRNGKAKLVEIVNDLVFNYEMNLVKVAYEVSRLIGFSEPHIRTVIYNSYKEITGFTPKNYWAEREIVELKEPIKLKGNNNQREAYHRNDEGCKENYDGEECAKVYRVASLDI